MEYIVHGSKNENRRSFVSGNSLQSKFKITTNSYSLKPYLPDRFVKPLI